MSQQPGVHRIHESTQRKNRHDSGGNERPEPSFRGDSEGFDRLMPSESVARVVPSQPLFTTGLPRSEAGKLFKRGAREATHPKH